jgi:hypothetical protein
MVAFHHSAAAMRRDRDRLSAGLRAMARRASIRRQAAQLLHEQAIEMAKERNMARAAVAVLELENETLRRQMADLGAQNRASTLSMVRAHGEVAQLHAEMRVMTGMCQHDQPAESCRLCAGIRERGPIEVTAAQRPDGETAPQDVCWCHFGDTCDVCEQTPVGAVRLHWLQVSGQTQTRKERWDGSRWIPDSMWRRVDDAFIPCPDEAAPDAPEGPESRYTARIAQLETTLADATEELTKAPVRPATYHWERYGQERRALIRRFWSVLANEDQPDDVPAPDLGPLDRRPVPAHPTTWTHPDDEQCVHCASEDRLASTDPVIDCPREECPDGWRTDDQRGGSEA